MAAMDSESIRSEVAFRFSRSSGPGGQHAQKTSTRVEALFDVEDSSGLTPAERERVLRRLGPVVRAVAQDERSQLRNRELATDRILEQLREATAVPRVRRATRPPAAANERRLEEKKRRARTKRLRRPSDDER
jgi:ribosome-associated protein